jgi:hypothetical protein
MGHITIAGKNVEDVKKTALDVKKTVKVITRS